MAYYALASLKGTINLEFLQSRSRVSLDHKQELKSLLEKLFSMQAFLSKKSGDDSVVIRELEIKIRDFALRTEDAIEMQLSNTLQLAKGTKFEDEARGELLQTLRQADEDAEELFKIINNTINEAKWVDDTYPSIHFFDGSLRCSSQLDEIVTFSHHRLFIDGAKDMLLRTNREHVVLPIFGMAGIGKTTLARKVYGDPVVASNFDVKAWVTVSHEYNLQQILCDLLHSMAPTVTIKVEGSTLFQLKTQLYKLLKGKRYFIVLDDLWNTQDYNDIQQCFPEDPCGSFILVTTMFVEVAEDSYNWGAWSMKLLNKDESWDLFCSRLSLKEYMAPKFEKIAKHVVKQCEGLPRSIVYVAERLSKCNFTLHEWKKIKKEIDTLGTVYGDAHYSRKLTLVYNQLSQNLKACFIYFAILPKGYAIQVKKVLKFWIAEGFVESFERRPLEDIAYEYLNVLVGKSLVRIDKRNYDYRPKICWLHGALHSFCVREAKKEGIFCAVNTKQCLGWSLDSLANSFRWISLCSHKLDYYVFFSSNNPRSVFFFHGDPEKFVPYKLLRTLDLSSSILKSVQLHLGGLLFLRYLSISQWFEGLDDVVKNNQNLQTLIISSVKAKHEAPPLHLPSRIWELPVLKHLDLGNMYTIDPPSMDKECLETLSWASPTHFRKAVHCKFPNLRNLKIFYKDVFEPSNTRRSCINPVIILENFEYLSRLRNLKVRVPVGSVTLLEGPLFHAQLEKLSLSGTNLPVSVLRVISRLPYLQSLKLENAFYGQEWEVAEKGFLKLEYLFLEARNLEKWVADANHFPNLCNLTIKHCYCLEEIPRDFVKLPWLDIIRFEGCPTSIVTSFREEVKDKKINTVTVSVDGIEYM